MVVFGVVVIDSLDSRKHATNPSQANHSVEVEALSAIGIDLSWESEKSRSSFRIGRRESHMLIVECEVAGR